jgi:hypothetical protein
MKTLSFPNFDENMPMQPTYDLGKWMSCMKNIYIKTHLGASRNDAIEQITQSWDISERRAFLDWMRYYESGDFKKYKVAQHSYYVNDDINYFLPNPKTPIPSPIRSMNDQVSSVQQDAQREVEYNAQTAELAKIEKQKQDAINKEEKRKLIEDHRRKILGRLNSAEKLLSSQQGQEFAGADFEKLLSAIYELKKTIQTVNKIQLSSQTIIDLIIRQASILKMQGYNSACSFLVKFAQQTPGDFSMQLGDTPAGGSKPDGQGSLGNNDPNLAQPAGGPQMPEEGSKEITDDSAVGKFLDNLEDFGITTEKDEDTNVVEDDEIEIGNDVLLDQEIEDDNEIVVHAQMVPQNDTPKPKKREAVVPAKEDNIEVESPAEKPGVVGETGMTPEEAKNPPQVSKVHTDFDALIDSAFSNLTVADVVKKLDDVNKIFRNREISRQLAIVDVMLDHLGLAPYFPSLAEATNKQLEANQYCLTRIEDVLSRLRGTMETANIDLKNEDQKLSPHAEGIKSGLEQEEQKEKQRKDVKKQMQDKMDMEKAVKPEAGIEGAPQEIANQPIEVESPAPKRQAVV